MSPLRIGPPLALKRPERLTLRASYSGEIGRGMFVALCTDFALMVATTVFGEEDRRWLWLLSSASYGGMLLAMLGVSLSQWRRKKTIVFVVEAAARLLAIGAAFAVSGPSFIVVMAAGIALNAIGVPLIGAIYGSNFGHGPRGPAVGRLQTATVAMAAATGVLLGAIMGLGQSYFRLLLVGVSAASLFLSYRAWRGLPEPRRSASTPQRPRFSDYLHILKTDHAFAYVQAYWFVFGFANLWLVPMRVLYLNDIGFNGRQITLATTAMIYTAMVLTTSLWGRILYRVNFGVYRLIVAFFFTSGVAIFFFSRSFPLICLGMFVWSTGFAGGNLSWRLVATLFTRPNMMASYMAVHAFLCGIRGIIGPYLSLGLHESQGGARTVATISIGVLLLSCLMLIPFIPMIEKRRQLLGETGK